MQKNNNPSKKTMLPGSQALSDQYRSQGSKSGANGLKSKQGTYPNMMEFKCQIDHQIAKCLDTLDRQGLKFLKETLRASKLFGLNTQELGNTQTIDENLLAQESVSPEKSQKKIVKKIEPIKPATSIKRITKIDSQKKTVPAKVVKPVEAKIDLSQKIHKKLQVLNIKTGKKIEQKQSATKKSQNSIKKDIQQAKPSNQIAEQIVVQQFQQQKKEQIIEQNMKNSQQVNANNQQSQMQKSKKIVREYPTRSQRKIPSEAAQRQQDNLFMKPFCKKQFKKICQDSKSGRSHRDYGVEISKQQDINQTDGQNINYKAKVEEITEEKNKQINEELNEQIQNGIGQIVDFNVESVDAQTMKQSQSRMEQSQSRMQKSQSRMQQSDADSKSPEIDSQLENLINKINKMSPSKRQKLQKIIQKLQDSKKDEASISLASDTSKEVSYFRPYVAQRAANIKKSDVMDRSKSRSRLEKHQKATSLQNSIIRKIPHSMTPQNIKKQNTSIVQTSKYDNIKVGSFVDGQSLPQKGVYGEQSNTTSQILGEEIQKSAEAKVINSISSVSLGESGQKLIKIVKKKNNPTTNIKIKILSNNGHPSMVGLQSIQMFDSLGDLIKLTESNIKLPNSKTFKLFSQKSQINEGWLSLLSNAIIQIDNITVQIAGIRIINLNKSELQNNKQADLVEVIINDQLHWRGQLRGGSYKEEEVYATDIKVVGREFAFPVLKNPSVVSHANQKSSTLNWLEKESVSQRMKEIQELEKSQVKTKKIQSIRGSNAGQVKRESQPIKDYAHQLLKPLNFSGINFKNSDNIKPSESVDLIKNRYSQKVNSSANLHSMDKQDILEGLSKGMGIKKREKEESAVQLRKKEELLMIQKEREQDEEFQKILMSMDKKGKNQKVALTKKVEVQPITNKAKMVADKKLQDFMKDSLFDDMTAKDRKVINKKNDQKQTKVKIQSKKQQQIKVSPFQTKKSNANDLDNLIDELNDMIGGDNPDQTGQQFIIPQLPKGSELTLTLLSNWGNQGYMGLNGIQLFDSQGNQIKPIDAYCTSISNRQLCDKLFKSELLTSDEKQQLKLPKTKKMTITIQLNANIQLSAIRLWNYNGHRVHSNIGVKKCHIKLDNIYIFSGEIQQSTGSSEDAYKYCEYILFTDSSVILKKIKEKDWLNWITRKKQEDNDMFKTTLENFHRPDTRNDEEQIKKYTMETQIMRLPIKLPKRQCNQYDPPLLPQGFILRIVLHSSWGDRFFIGLNGIQVFNDKGQNIVNKGLVQIRADPSSINKLQGYERDKRVITNLINGKNNTTADTNIWLAPLLSDVDKIEHGKANTILLQFNKANRIGGINFYNYIKTPQRGVRQIQIFMDNFLIYRGYLRKYSKEQSIIHTTVNFTKQLNLLQAMNYVGYNEDHLQQQVGLINQQKLIKATNQTIIPANLMNRPLTGKLN